MTVVSRALARSLLATFLFPQAVSTLSRTLLVQSVRALFVVVLRRATSLLLTHRFISPGVFFCFLSGRDGGDSPGFGWVSASGKAKIRPLHGVLDILIC